MVKTNNIKKGDLVVATYRGGAMLDRCHGVVVKLERWHHSGLTAKVHFMDGREIWLDLERLEKLNK